jgi:hypothetical protein
MDVADLNTKIHREENLDTVKDDFDGDSEDEDEAPRPSVEEEDQAVTIDD